jgi:hypothetical protein
LYFAFTWEPATDDDGDAIVNYEFFLSRDSCMRFPHSPNFNLFVSAFGEGSIRPHFKVKETGWLNHGETYYWRVRARDARGAWSEWSDTWSFTPHGVMRPVNGKAEIVGQSIRLSWERNPTGKQPDFYKIYGSDEMNGFSPNDITWFASTDSTVFIIPFDKKQPPFSFFRIAACDTLGQESLVSDVIAIPYPYMYAAFDSVSTDSLFRMNLFTNEKFYPFIHFIYQEDLYFPIVTVEQKPDWLNYVNKTLYSTNLDFARWLLFQDSANRSVVLSMNDYMGSGNVFQTIVLETTAVNRPPELMLSDSVACENSYFIAYITSIDGDVAFGDTNFYTILQKPDWLFYETRGDTLFLLGIPIKNPEQDSLLRILAVDTKNDSTIVEYFISIIPYLQILSATSDSIVINEPYSFSLVTNRDEDYFSNISFSISNLPQWMEVDFPSVFGTPGIQHLNDTILRFAMYDRFCNQYLEHEVVFFIQHVNHPPTIVTTALSDALENSLYIAHIIAYDIDSLVENVILTYKINPDTSWLSIDAETGVLEGTPLRENIFDNIFWIIVCDQHNACDSVEFHIYIDWLNRTPELILIHSPVQEDSIYFGLITSIDGDVAVGDSHIYIPFIMPEWIDFYIDGDTVFLEGIPTRDNLNDTIIRILAIDRKHESAIYEFSIRIIPNPATRNTPLATARNLHSEIIASSTENLYYAKIQTSKNTGFRYDLYSINGTRLYSSPIHHLMEGVHYLQIDMNNHPAGIYIFVGYENNQIRQSVKFIKQ